MLSLVFMDSDRIGSKLIRLATWSEYSHVGLLDNSSGTIIDARFGLGGVTEYKFDTALKDYPRIEVVSLPMASSSALDHARGQVGKPYDWTALLGFAIRRNWQEDDSWFCSELVAWACAAAGTPIINKESWRVSPQDLLEVSVRTYDLR